MPILAQSSASPIWRASMNQASGSASSPRRLDAAGSRIPCADSPRYCSSGTTATTSWGSCVDALGESPLQSFHGGDRHLLAHVATLGRIAHVHAPLMTIRDHAGRYTRSKTKPAERAKWHDARNTGRFSFPHWRLYGSFWEIVGGMQTGLGDQLRASAVLVWWVSSTGMRYG